MLAAGVIITDLQGTFQRVLFNEFVWAFGLAPDAQLGGAVADESPAAKNGDGGELLDPDDRQPRSGRPLPMHVFRKGDPVLLLHALEDGSLPSRSVRMRQSTSPRTMEHHVAFVTPLDLIDAVSAAGHVPVVAGQHHARRACFHQGHCEP